MSGSLRRMTVEMSNEEVAGHSLRSSWPLFLGLALVMVGNGLQGSLVGLRSTLEGFESSVSGLIQAAYFAGFLIGSRLAARAVSEVGHIRVFAALASTASSAALVHALFVSAPTWAAVRFVTGLCMAGLFVVVESWLNGQATNENRGRVLAVYMVVSMGGLGFGNMLLGAADPTGFRLFALASVLISMALVPVTLSATTSPPQVPSYSPMSVRALFDQAQIGIVLALFVGMSHGVLLGLGPVYAGLVGLGTTQLSWFVGLPILGAVVLQWGIGAVSDRVSRRVVIAAVASCAVGAALVAGWMGHEGVGIVTLTAVFVLGAFSFPLYGLTIAYTNDFLDHSQRIGAGTTLIAVNGVGAVVGPLAGGAAMQAWGASWFFVALVATHGMIAIYLLVRILARRPRPEMQEPWEPVPPRSSGMIEELLGPDSDLEPEEWHASG